ncbi:activating transcription factor 7-interacting protein 1 isoform X2 [Lingula anatina]|uniref:Activating transcription factor 7-interacting protein 1 isoform X2 n=1 Tax=Lingula anatina TaxID=7574 RepID=A0A2R2MTS7_LINAN|nr:activating transcription factor 7-interacting protein 1 isoform X2 [Lingula anatina]|eukprot:XP_023933685.1 activating transcription factor 7-interacting protein 1 isoform X2 [Lingula anatina]
MARLQAATMAEKQAVVMSGDDEKTENCIDNGDTSYLPNKTTVIDNCAENISNSGNSDKIFSSSGGIDLVSSMPVENGCLDETSVDKTLVEQGADSSGNLDNISQDQSLRIGSTFDKAKSNSVSSSVSSSCCSSPFRQDQGNLFEKLTSHFKELEPTDKKDACEKGADANSIDLNETKGEPNLDDNHSQDLTNPSEQVVILDTKSDNTGKNIVDNFNEETLEGGVKDETLESDKILPDHTEDILLENDKDSETLQRDEEDDTVPEDKEDELLQGDMDDISERSGKETQIIEPQNSSDNFIANNTENEVPKSETHVDDQSNFISNSVQNIVNCQNIDGHPVNQDSVESNEPTAFKIAVRTNTETGSETNDPTSKRSPPGSPENRDLVLKKPRLEEERNPSICDSKDIKPHVEDEDSKSQFKEETETSESQESKSLTLKNEDAFTSDNIKNVFKTDDMTIKPEIETTDGKVKSELDSKSRLEGILNKLGSRVPLENAETSHEDNEDSASVDSKDSADTTSSTSADSEDTSSNCKKKSKKVKLTRQQLEVYLKRHVEANLKTNNDGVINQLHEKIRDLQNCNEAWKQQVKEMQQQVLELTIQHQRMKKKYNIAINKQHTHAVKPHIQTRTVATQLFPEMIVRAMNQNAKSQTATSPGPGKFQLVPVMTASSVAKSTVTSPASTVLTQPSLVQSGQTTVPQVQPSGRPVPASPNPATQLPTVRSMIEAQRSGVNVQIVGGKQMLVTSPTRGSVGTPASQAATDQPGKLATTSITAGKGNNVTTTVSKVIDLTDDDVGSGGGTQELKKTTSMTLVHPSQIMQQKMSTNQIRPGTQVIFQPTSSFNPTGAVYVLPQRPGAPAAPSQFTLVPVSSGTVGTRPTLVSLVTRAGLRQSLPSSVVTQTAAKLPQQVTVSAKKQLTIPPPPLHAAPVQKPASTVTVSSTAQSPVEAAGDESTSMQGRISHLANKRNQLQDILNNLRHPAPLPPLPANQDVTTKLPKVIPPKPDLKINRVTQGIVLSWNMNVEYSYEHISSYQLFAYQEGSLPPSTSLWKKVGEVNALPLPMACTLTQFQEGNRYHFAVRAADKHGRVGPFSDPSSIHLVPNGK